MPLELPPTFVMSKTAVPLPPASTDTEMMRTERSAGDAGTLTGVGVGDGVGEGAGEGAGAGAGVGCTEGEGEGVALARGAIFTVALPSARSVGSPELVEVALGRKITVRGVLRSDVPERYGVSDIVFPVPPSVYAAPHGIPTLPTVPGVWNERPLVHG